MLICIQIRHIDDASPCLNLCETDLVLWLLTLLSTLSFRFFRSRHDLLLENPELRHPLEVLRRRRPQPRFTASHRLFWVTLWRLEHQLPNQSAEAFHQAIADIRTMTACGPRDSFPVKKVWLQIASVWENML